MEWNEPTLGAPRTDRPPRRDRQLRSLGLGDPLVHRNSVCHSAARFPALGLFGGRVAHPASPAGGDWDTTAAGIQVLQPPSSDSSQGLLGPVKLLRKGRLPRVALVTGGTGGLEPRWFARLGYASARDIEPRRGRRAFTPVHLTSLDAVRRVGRQV